MEHKEDGVSEPMSIARCRELLGEEADGLSDREVDRIRQRADGLAHVIIEMYLDNRAVSE